MFCWLGRHNWMPYKELGNSLMKGGGYGTGLYSQCSRCGRRRFRGYYQKERYGKRTYRSFTLKSRSTVRGR